MLGSGCGTVGQAVASDTKDLRVESRQQHNFIDQSYKRKDKNKEKVTREWPIFKKVSQICNFSTVLEKFVLICI